MKTKENKVQRPSFLLWFTEVSRAIGELAWFCKKETQMTKTKTGDGHPVLVIPGFMASDGSTIFLRRFLNKIGYNAYGWELGRNKGRKDNDERTAARLLEIYKETGQKVSIVGWSLGGIYGRQIAKMHPDITRQVITLGSPFSGLTEPNNAAWLYNLISKDGGVKDIDPELLADLPKPIPVPSTAIYSKEDGIVSWKVCQEQELCEIRQNIQIRGSHIGLGVNPTVLNIIADRLQYKKENWRKFEPKSTKENNFYYPRF